MQRYTVQYSILRTKEDPSPFSAPASAFQVMDHRTFYVCENSTRHSVIPDSAKNLYNEKNISNDGSLFLKVETTTTTTTKNTHTTTPFMSH